MTLNEFKQFLAGFNAAINGAPTKEQWELIQKKIAEITPDVKVKTEFVERVVERTIEKQLPWPKVIPLTPYNPNPYWPYRGYDVTCGDTSFGQVNLTGNKSLGFGGVVNA